MEIPVGLHLVKGQQLRTPILVGVGKLKMEEIGSQIKGIVLRMAEILVMVGASPGIGSRPLVVAAGEEGRRGRPSKDPECAGSLRVVTARRAQRVIICTRTSKIFGNTEAAEAAAAEERLILYSKFPMEEF